MTYYTYTTADKVANELRATTDFAATTNPSIDTVTDWINELSAYINDIAGRTYGETSYTETFDYSGEDILTLSNAPITTVTSLLYSTARLGTDDYDLSDTKTEDTHFTVYDKEGEIEILKSNWNPSSGLKRIQVNYKAGFETIPSTIQMLATKLVTKRVIDTLLSKDINEKQSGKSVSVGSISIVKPADFGVKQYEKLQGDISRLEEDIISGTTLYRLPATRQRRS